ncbi:MAG: hypothetical protein V1836_00485 [Candidatus Aenigmatarchaeota archaeon]
MVVAFILAILSAFMISRTLIADKYSYERLFVSLVLSFVILFVSGVLLNFLGQINYLALIAVNAVFLAALFYKYKTLELDLPKLDLVDIAVIVVFLLALVIRAAPAFSDPMPFGSYDIIQHYAMAMETYERGSVPNDFPKYLNWFGTSQDNVNGVWVYPPGTAIMMATLKAAFGFSWPFTIYFFSALLDALTAIIIYLFAGTILKSKGVGLVAASLFAISGKNLYSLYFGQVAYEFGIMLAAFALFAFAVGRAHQKFVLLSGIAGGLSFIVSPLAAGYFLFASFFISLYGSLKAKKISHMKEFTFVVVLSVIVSLFFLPKFAMWFSFFGAKSTADAFNPADLVWPFKMIEKQPGLPGWYFDPLTTMGSAWLVLLVAGLALLAFTKFEGRGVVAAWFVADYILTHSYLVWGPLGYSILYDYAGRWMAQSSVILALIAGLAGMYFFSNKNNKLKISASEGISLALVIATVIVLIYAPEKLVTASGIYAQPYRMSPDMYSVLPEIRQDTKPLSAILVLSPSVQAADERRGLIEAFSKTRVYTQPQVSNNTLNLEYVHNYTTGSITYNTRYIMFDYGGFAKSSQFSSYVQGMTNFEKSLFSGKAPDFVSGDVRVYKIGTA